jgi:gamma-glutamyltranspeptidase
LREKGYETKRHPYSYMMPILQTIRINNGNLDGGADPSGDGMATGF